jgi:hypothetical protein
MGKPMVQEVELPTSVSHGTHNAYTNYRCRCEPCREAQAAYRATLRARDPEKYSAHASEYQREYRARKRQEHADQT